MHTLPRSTIRRRQRSRLKGALFVLALAAIFTASFLGALYMIDSRNTHDPVTLRPATVFLRDFFNEPEAAASEDQSVDLQHVPIVMPPAAPALEMEPHTTTIAPPIDVIDVRTFVNEGIIYRITSIQGPERDAICLDAEDRLWACGLQARAAFNNLTRETGMICEGDLFLELAIARVTCLAGEDDLAVLLVESGFALPDAANQDDDLFLAQTRAEEENNGLWNGGWRYRD